MATEYMAVTLTILFTIATSIPLGRYMARVFAGERTWLATFAIVTLQKWLPLNPDGIDNMEPTLAFNTISSFTTNTNLQHYSGETGLSYFSQMFAITFLQFVTAATGIAACVAIIRGLGGNRLQHLGNFYVDLTRATVRVFLPLALLVSVFLM